MAKPNFDRVWLALHVYLQAVFNEKKLLSAKDWKVFVGLAGYLTTPAAPDEFKDQARAKQLGAVCTYALGRMPQAVTVSDDGRGSSRFAVPRNVGSYDVKMSMAPAYFFKRRADLVIDDEDELTKCAFHYTSVATKLTPGYRRKVYSGYLNNILPPQEEDGGFFDSGATFVALARERATYLGLDDSYYAKWLVEAPSKKKKSKDREFGFDQLTDAYIVENFVPYVLRKGAVYAYLRLIGTGIAVVIQLDLDATKHGQLTWKLCYAEGLPLYGDFFAMVSERLETLKESKISVTAEASFYYALDGTSDDFLKLFSIGADQTPRSAGDTYFEQVVDPQYVVQSARGLPFDQIEHDKKDGRTSRYWFKEMVRLRFSEPWVWFWNNTYLQMFYNLDREALFLKELRAAEQEAAGSLKQKLRDFRQEAERDTKILLVRRGSKYGKLKRVIGSDTSYVYLYNNQADLVTRVPMGIFWRNTNIAAISTVIFNNTKGMIPISKVIAWGGVAVMGWGIFGTATLVNGFRQYVADRVRGALADAALRERFIEIRNRVLLSLLNPLLALVPVDQTNSTAARAFSFFRGFLLGYTHDAFVAMYQRWDSLAALEPTSYKAIKLLMKIEGVLRIVDEKVSLIKDKVGMRIGGLLLNRFVAAFVTAMHGIIGMVNNLYFLDYERVEEFLKAYTDLTGEKAPTKAEWDKLRHKHFLATFREYQAAIEKEATNVKEIYQDVRKGIEILQRALRLAETYLIVEVVSGGVLMAMVMHALTKGAKVAWKGAKYGAGAAIIGATVSSTFREALIEALKDFAQVTAKGTARVLKFSLGSTLTPERMEKLGQLIGQVWGGITLNKAVFGKKTWLQHWDSSKSYKGFVTKNFLKSQLSVSPILPIIKLALFNYVFLIEKAIEDTKEVWKSFEAELDEILLGDPEFRDIIEDDHQLTLLKIIKIINAVDLALTKWLRKLAEEPELTEHINKLADLLQKVSPGKLPTFKMLREGSLPDGWSREAVMFVVMSHLQAALRLLASSINDLHTSVDPQDDTAISIMYLLQILGFQQSESELEEVLDRNFDDAFEASTQP